MTTLVFISNFDAVTCKIYADDSIKETTTKHLSKDAAIFAAWDILSGIIKDMPNIIGYDFNPSEIYINTDEGTIEYDDSIVRFSIYIYE